MFINNAILFARANMSKLTNPWDILRKYELWSDCKINVQKSGIFFSKNANEDRTHFFCPKPIVEDIDQLLMKIHAEARAREEELRFIHSQ